MIRSGEASDIVGLLGPLAPPQKSGEHPAELWVEFPALFENTQAFFFLGPCQRELIGVGSARKVFGVAGYNLEIAPEEAIASASALPLGFEEGRSATERLGNLPGWVRVHHDVLDNDAHSDAHGNRSAPKKVPYPRDFPK